MAAALSNISGNTPTLICNNSNLPFTVVLTYQGQGGQKLLDPKQRFDAKDFLPPDIAASASETPRKYEIIVLHDNKVLRTSSIEDGFYVALLNSPAGDSNPGGFIPRVVIYVREGYKHKACRESEATDEMVEVVQQTIQELTPLIGGDPEFGPFDCYGGHRLYGRGQMTPGQMLNAFKRVTGKNAHPPLSWYGLSGSEYVD